MSEIKALDKLREQAEREPLALTYILNDIADEIEAEVADNYMPKNNAEIDKTAVQEYNLTVHVADGQTIEYNTELRHRCGAATSMSVAFRLE